MYMKVQELDRKIEALKSRLILHVNMKGTKSWWKGIDAITHRKQTTGTSKIISNAFDPIQLNFELSQRSALRQSTTRQPPPDFKLDGHSAPQLSMHDVFSVLKKCKRSSTGPVNIPHFIFHEYCDILVPLYHYVWNRFIAAGIFPKCYKVANLLPLPKVKCAKRAEDIR